MNRRDALKLTGAAAALSWMPTSGVKAATDAYKKLRLAGYDYDRVLAIIDKRVGIQGVDLDFDVADIYTVSASAFGNEKTYDVTEIGLLPFIDRFINHGFRAYTLIPIFISRTFRHRNIFVHADSGISKPEDLRGMRIGTPGYGFSAHTWIRGMLADEYGVNPEEMQWIETTRSSDGGPVSQELNRRYLPDTFPLVKGPPGIDESDLLISGGCDALITAITPRAFAEGDPRIQRLFPNAKAAEQAYFMKTGIFPIMHAVAIRTELAQENPTLPKALFEVYSKAKQIAYDNLMSTTALKVTLPWIMQEFEDTRKIMGDNFWSYGISANRKELELAMRYSYEQGLTKRQGLVEELFHPSTLELIEESG